MKTPDEEPAAGLARFLESRSPDDAAGLDDDVREALFAIRPDLAPPPRSNPDDILASVRRGPLASDEPLSTTPLSARSREGAVVQFPGIEDDARPSETAEVTPSAPDRPGDPSANEPSPSPNRSSGAHRWPFVARPSAGILLLAAAATLLIVSRPLFEGPAESSSRPASELALDAPAESRSEPTSGRAPELALEAQPVAPEPPADAAPPPASEIAAAPAPLSGSESEAEPPPSAGIVIARGNRSTQRRGLGPARGDPGVADDLAEDVDALAVPEGSGPAGRIPEVEADARADGAEAPAVDIDALRSLARPRDLDPVAWRDGLTEARLASVDEALAAAEAARRAGDPVLAGELLSPFATRPPARAAQHLAARAARDFLAGREAVRAEGVARDALPLGRSPTPERSDLLFVLGLALEAQGSDDAAADAFRAAAEANRSR